MPFVIFKIRILNEVYSFSNPTDRELSLQYKVARWRCAVNLANCLTVRNERNKEALKPAQSSARRAAQSSAPAGAQSSRAACGQQFET